jgi:apolipoprotein N-acyltransferase
MQRFVKLWPAAASAVLVLAAFPPINLGLLSLVGLAPLLAALMKGSAKRALALGYVFGFLYMLAQMQFVQILVTRWTNNPPLALLTWVLAGFLGAWYFALFGWLANRCFQRGWIWMVPLVWAGIEVFRSYIPGLAFPWGLLADPLWPYPPIIQSAYFGSIYFVSAWCVLCSMVLAMWLGGGSWMRLRPYATIFTFGLALSLARMGTPLPTKKIVVTAGQLGVDTAFGNHDALNAKIYDAVTHLTASAILTKSQLLVLPEGIADGTTSDPPRMPFPIDPNVPVIFGGLRGTNPTYQSAYSYDGQKWGHADKSHLVIFGEYVPFRHELPFLDAFQLPSGDLTPAQDIGVLDVRGMKVGPLVCFDSMFPDVAYRQSLQGAQLLAVISIDDWYMHSAAPEQLRSESVWRAVETGLPLVRSASLGYSMAIDGHGNVLVEAPLGKMIPLRAEIPIPDKPSPFPLYPVFPIVCLGSIVGAFLIPWLPKGRGPFGSLWRLGRRANAGGQES